MLRRHNKNRNTSILNRIEPTLQHEGFTYTFILAYFLLNVLFFFRGASPEWELAGDEIAFIRMTRACARGTGSILNINSALVLLGALKIILTFLRRTVLNIVVPFDKAMPSFHRLVGSTIAAAAIIHTIAHTIRYAMRGMGTLGGMHGSLALLITGIILIISLGAISITTVGPLREMISFELWGFCHITGMVLFFSVLPIHGSHHGKFSSYKFVLAPLLLYIVDIILRRLRSRFEVVLIAGDTAKTVGPNIVKLQMLKEKHFPYLAGQYCYLKVPLLSKIEWHPFSLASSPHENYVTFYVKVNGNWTSKLYDLCTRDGRDGTTQPLNIRVFVSGAHGAPAEHVGQYEHVVLISGGVGATPFTSITKFIHNRIMNNSVIAHDYAKSPHATFQINYTIQAYEARKKRKQLQKASKEGYEKRAASLKSISSFSDGLDKNGNRKSSIGTSRKSSTLVSSLGDPTEAIPSRKSLTLTDSSDLRALGEKIEEYLMLEHEISSMGIDSIGRGIRSFTSAGMEKERDEDLVPDEPTGWKCQSIVVLHSITINFVLLWIMFLRFGMFGIAKITGAFSLQQKGFNVYSNLALNVTDLILAIMLLFPLGATLISRIKSYGPKNFLHVMNVCDVLVLAPLSFACTFFHVLGFYGTGADTQHVSKFTVLCIWSVITLFLFLRIILSDGYRIAVAPFRKAQTKSLDFIWVNRTSEQDKWILDELLPIATGPVRIHRFLTGQKREAEDVGWKDDFIDVPFETTYTRPDWDEVFLKLIENSASGSVIGVFFCGASKMQHAVQEAAVNAMQQSIRNSLERGYDSASRRRQKDGEERSFDNLNEFSDDKAALGCNIRISVRVENFS